VKRLKDEDYWRAIEDIRLALAFVGVATVTFVVVYPHPTWDTVLLALCADALISVGIVLTVFFRLRHYL
jgi:hypothetical protein